MCRGLAKYTHLLSFRKGCFGNLLQWRHRTTLQSEQGELFVFIFCETWLCSVTFRHKRLCCCPTTHDNNISVSTEVTWVHLSPIWSSLWLLSKQMSSKNDLHTRQPRDDATHHQARARQEKILGPLSLSAEFPPPSSPFSFLRSLSQVHTVSRAWVPCFVVIVTGDTWAESGQLQ